MNSAKLWGKRARCMGAVTITLALAGCGAPKAVESAVQPNAGSAQAPLLQSKENHDFAQEIERLFQNGDYGTARQKAEQWQAQHPNDPDGFTALGRVLSMQGDFDGAIRNGRAAIAANARYDEIVKSWLDETLLIRKRYPNLQLFPMTPIASPSEVARDQLKSQAAALLQTKNYDEIDKIAARLLQSRATLPDESWQLDAFALGLCIAPPGEAAWQANNARLQAWHRARPNSNLARLMLGRSWSDGSGRARGEEAADKVSPAQWAQMNQRLAQAAPLLSASIKDIKRTPLVFSTLQDWALLGQVPRPAYEKAWKQATTAFPDYTEFYITKAQFLMPRWYGQPGEWEAFAKNSADKLGGARGDKLYARIVLDQSLYFGEEFFAASAVSWPRTKRGINAILADTTDKVTIATQAHRLASIAGDLEFQRQLFRGPLSRAFATNYVSAKDLYSERIYVFTH